MTPGASGEAPLRDEGTARRRLRILVVGCVLLSSVYLYRIADLQLVESEKWRALAVGQNAAQVEIPARRGAILDREGRTLARDAGEYRAYFAPAETRDPARAAARVSQLLGLSESQARRLESSRSGWIALPRRVSAVERDRLMGSVRRGLHFERLSTRTFPEGRLAPRLLGSVSPEGEGRSGLELALDSLLRGESGAALARRDARGRQYRLPDAQLDRPSPGADVFLTLDAELQRIAEDALKSALRQTGASGGDVLMLDPATGEILAVASRSVDGGSRVPALTDPYEPGSTLKPFLLASLLAESGVDLSETVDTEGGTLREGFREIRDVYPRDTLTVAEVVRYSSNVGAAKLARRLSPAQQYRYLRDFGFGLPTGIEYPAEAAGRLRRPGSWSALSQFSLAMGYELSVTSLQLSAAYAALANDGVLMRPYLVRELRGEDGEVLFRREPEAVRRVVSADVARQVTGVLRSVVEEGTATRAALASLQMAGKTGTARIASASGYAEGRYSASFVGYLPAEDPALVILTKLDDPQGEFYGGLTAAPMSRGALQAALATRGVRLAGSRLLRPSTMRLDWGGPEPGGPEAGGAGRASGGPGPSSGDDPFVLALHGEGPQGAAAAGAERAGPPGSASGRARPEDGYRRLPDLTDVPLRTAAARLHELGLRVAVEGSDRVREQEPSPGTRVDVGTLVRLR